MQRVQPPVTIEQLLKELAHSTHVHRTQQTSKARQPPKEQGGGSLVLVRVAHFSSSLLAHAFITHILKSDGFMFGSVVNKGIFGCNE